MKEYKIIKHWDTEKIERQINFWGGKGWRVVSCTMAQDREHETLQEIIVILEKDK